MVTKIKLRIAKWKFGSAYSRGGEAEQKGLSSTCTPQTLGTHMEHCSTCQEHWASLEHSPSLGRGTGISSREKSMTRKEKVRGALVFCGCKLLHGLKQPNLLSCISAADSNPDLSGPKTRCHQGCTPARGSMGNPHLFWLCFWECPFSLACTAYSTA